jgi:hypothetical protein
VELILKKYYFQLLQLQKQIPPEQIPIENGYDPNKMHPRHLLAV